MFGRSVRATEYERIRTLPGFQTVFPGTVFPAVPSAKDAFIVLRHEPERFVVLGWMLQPNETPVTTWALILEELKPGWTRLIERGRVRSPYSLFGLPEWLAKRLAPLGHAVIGA